MTGHSQALQAPDHPLGNRPGRLHLYAIYIALDPLNQYILSCIRTLFYMTAKLTQIKSVNRPYERAYSSIWLAIIGDKGRELHSAVISRIPPQIEALVSQFIVEELKQGQRLDVDSS